MSPRPRALPWLQPGQPFPPLSTAWTEHDPAPGLLAAGGALDVPTLLDAYRHGIFPWFSEGQPILWWSPQPRMVLETADFRLSDSLRKTLRSGLRRGRIEVRVDSRFAAVIRHCADTPRRNQSGTWIVPSMVDAYQALHQAGHAHSVETWWDGELAGGLYCVNLGRMVFGESMFSRRNDASKIALAALVAFCRANGVAVVDCQQNTSHLASLGAREWSRERFIHHVQEAIEAPAPPWDFRSVYWQQLWTDPSPT